jgi:hypothetical protein
MSTVFSHAADRDRDVERLRAVLRGLPAESRASVEQRLSEAAIAYQQSGDPASLVHFAESLLLGAQLRQNPDYVKASREAENDDFTGDGVSVEEMLAAVRERRSRRR